jgi:TolB-like protein/tetratricopeptide (TPR) repeat protein
VFGLLTSFAAELRRRHVTRVTVVYCAVGWAVAEVSATVFPSLGIPGWAVSLVTMVLILGLPVAVVLAWAFDLTAEGVRRTPRAIKPRRGPSTGSVAVLSLPFIDRSAAADHQYLGDGIAEELINALARITGLRVVSRTSAFALRTATPDPRELGERFGVTHVIEGSVAVADGRIRLVVQLICVRDGYAVWSRVFERRLENIFVLQEEMAQAMVQSLQPALLSGTSAGRQLPAARRPTPDFAAYASYLRGRQQWNERSPAALQKALDHFNEALQRDPRYALAHAGVADCWAILVDHGIISHADGLPRAEAAAAEAVRLCPDLAEARTSEALVLQLGWRWRESEAAFRAALDLNPAYSIARQRLALLLAWLGRFAEARREIGLAVQTDPLSSAVAATRVWIEYLARSPAAVATALAILEEQPRAHAVRLPLALALAQDGRAGEGASHLEALLPATAGNAANALASAAASRPAAATGERCDIPSCAAEQPLGAPLLGVYAYVLGRAGHRIDAEQVAWRLENAAQDGFVSRYSLALALLGSGRVAAALPQLEAARAERLPELIRLRFDPAFDILRQEPRFQQVVSSVEQGA